MDGAGEGFAGRASLRLRLDWHWPIRSCRASRLWDFAAFIRGAVSARLMGRCELVAPRREMDDRPLGSGGVLL